MRNDSAPAVYGSNINGDICMTDTYFATCKIGLESVVAGELRDLGIEVLRVSDARVDFAGDHFAMARACLWLRTAERVLMKLASFRAVTFDELYEGVRRIRWKDYLLRTSFIHVNGKSAKSRLFSVSDCQSIAKKAIVDSLSREYGLKILPENGRRIIIEIGILRDEVTVALDCCGAGLSRWGYRTYNVPAPISETLGAAIVMLSGYRQTRPLIDPMCGSGTIPIEAALIARNIAPGVFRKEFAFEKWNDFDQELFDTIYNDDSQEREFTHKVYGYDNNPKANEIATHNVKAAGLSKEVILKIQPFQQFEQPKEKSIIITNPPYGERISTNDLLGLYQMIGERLKHAFAGNDAWILSYREECFDQIGLKPSVKVPLFNGALECEFRKYQLFDGKYKEFRTENKDRDFKPRREDTRPRRNSERVEYGERRERRNFDDKREGRGDFKNRDRKDRGNEERKEFKPRFKREEK